MRGVLGSSAPSFTVEFFPGQAPTTQCRTDPYELLSISCSGKEDSVQGITSERGLREDSFLFLCTYTCSEIELALFWWNSASHAKQLRSCGKGGFQGLCACASLISSRSLPLSVHPTLTFPAHSQLKSPRSPQSLNMWHQRLSKVGEPRLKT